MKRVLSRDVLEWIRLSWKNLGHSGLYWVLLVDLSLYWGLVFIGTLSRGQTELLGSMLIQLFGDVLIYVSADKLATCGDILGSARIHWAILG